MVKVPFYIMEEHHEAFFIWHYAVAEGLLDKAKNILLHVDQHSDMALPRCLKTPLKSVNGNLRKLRELTYSELTIANFIYPAIYQGLFSKVYWLRQNHGLNAGIEKKMHIYSHQGEGKRLILKPTLDYRELFNPDCKFFSLIPITVQNSFFDPEAKEANHSVVLDIDIDYFSCNNASGEYIEFEVTQDTYHDYINNPYNKIHLNFGAMASVKYRDGKYYFCTVPPEELVAENLKVSEEAIVERIDAFVNFLKVNQIQPKLIDVCRSRMSGYTPNDQWEFIEHTLVEKLSSIYDFDPVFVSELSNQVLSAA